MRIVCTPSILLTAALFVGCGGKQNTVTTANNTNTPPPPVDAGPPPAAKLRVINASPDGVLASVNAFIDTGDKPLSDHPIDFKAATPFGEIPSGSHALKIRKVGDAGEPVVSADSTFAPEKMYTAVIHGIPGGDPAAGIEIAMDPAQPVEAGKARLRLFHALAGGGAVDVCTVPARRGQPSTPIMANVLYGKWGDVGGSAYLDITPDQEYKFQLRAQNAAPCTGAIVGSASAFAAAGTNVSVIVMGSVARRGATPAILLCTDPPNEPEFQVMPLTMGH